MLKVVENALAIRRYERLFVRSLKPLATATLPVKLGHPGASEKVKIAWSEQLGIWSLSRKIAGLRYWHAFGIGRPASGGAIAITCEINFPLCGIDRRTGGAFAQDPSGRVFVIHRGKLGGGRKGVGKSFFEERYRGVWEIIDDGDVQTPVAVVGALQSPRFARQLAQFVHQIAQLKEGAVERSLQTEMAFDEPAVREALIGDPYPRGAGEYGAGCDRGLVVRDLADVFGRQGFKAGNDRRWDLAIRDHKGTVRAVFQVRPAEDPTGLLAAAAKLLLAAPDLPAGTRLCLVVPAAPEGDLRERLQKVKIDWLTYRWEGDRAFFPELSPLLAQIAL